MTKLNSTPAFYIPNLTRADGQFGFTEAPSPAPMPYIPQGHGPLIDGSHLFDRAQAQTSASKPASKPKAKTKNTRKSYPRSKTKKSGLTASQKRKLNDISKARQKDLAKTDAKQAWQSDDMARSFIEKNGDALKHLSDEQRELLLRCLLDNGAGDAAITTQEDGEALVKLLKSMPAEERVKLIDKLGLDSIIKTMKGKCDDVTCQAVYDLYDAGKKTINEARAQRYAAGSGADALAVSKAHFRQVNDEINDVTKQLKNTTDKNRREELRMKLQELMQEKRQIFELITTMLKQMHDMAMSAIRKI